MKECTDDTEFKVISTKQFYKAFWQMLNLCGTANSPPRIQSRMMTAMQLPD